MVNKTLCCVLLCTFIGLGILGGLLYIGITNDWDVTENDYMIKNCIEGINKSTDFDIHPVWEYSYDYQYDWSWTVVGFIGLTLCVACYKGIKDEDVDDTNRCYGCCGCICMVGTGLWIAIYLHFAIYMFAMNQEFEKQDLNDCSEYDAWQTAFFWSFIGGCLSAALVLLCCISCCVAWCNGIKSAMSEQEKDRTPAFQPRPTPPQSSPSPPRNNNDAVIAIGDGDEEALPLTRLLLTAEVIEQLGFSLASPKNILILLAAVFSMEPDGGTALRDAIMYSIGKLMALKLVLKRLNTIDYKFVHIVLTDGEDTSSDSTLTDIQNIYRKLGQELGDTFFKTFFIGIDLGYRARQELQSIANLAGDSAELINCRDVEMADIFQRIKLSLGLQTQIAFATDGTNVIGARADRVVLQAEKQKFLVLFDLDRSYSMKTNGRWQSLQKALAEFFKVLDDSDIIGLSLFNDKPICFTGQVLNQFSL